MTLEILNTVEYNSEVTQRHLADHLGVALGLANSYMKRCIRKGLIKIQQAPANRYLYYLTPQGFTEKSRLTAEYLRSSFDFYRNASRSLSDLFAACEREGRRRIVLCGASELAEISLIRAQEYDVEIIGIWDPDRESDRFLSLPVWRELPDPGSQDALLVTDLSNPAATLERIRGRGKVLVPSILGLGPADGGRNS